MRRVATADELDRAVRRYGPERAPRELWRYGLIPPIAGASGLAIDTSTPAYASSTGSNTATSAAFSPPANSQFVLLFTNSDTGDDVTAVTDSLGTHLSYTQQVFDVSGVAASIWTAPCPSPQTNMTITATWGTYSRSNKLCMGILVFTGAASSQSGAHASANNSPLSATLASAASTSWVVGSFSDGRDQAAPTIPGGQTNVFNSHTFQLIDAAAGTMWGQANSAAGNGNLTLNVTAPAGPGPAVVYEVQAAAGGGAAPLAPPLVYGQAVKRAAFY